MKNRIREIRESLTDEYGKKLSQAKFAEKLGVAVSSAQKWEIGASIPSNATIKLICDKFGVNETWLRTGDGEMYAQRSRHEEMSALVESLMADDPESFRSRLVTALLRFDPNGPEWDVLERIYESIAEEAENTGE